MSRIQSSRRRIAILVAVAAALVAAAAEASPTPGNEWPNGAAAVAQSPQLRGPVPPPRLDSAQATYLRECMGNGAAASQRRAYCQCSYQQLRRRYNPQQYAQLDDWIRSGPPELRRFAVVAWEPEFAPCRPLLPGSGGGAALPKGRSEPSP